MARAALRLFGEGEPQLRVQVSGDGHCCTYPAQWHRGAKGVLHPLITETVLSRLSQAVLLLRALILTQPPAGAELVLKGAQPSPQAVLPL